MSLYRAALGVDEGDKLIVVKSGDSLRLLCVDAAVREVQQTLARHIPEDVSLVDELIADRRREATREVEDD